jgi:hypothetical protein
MNRFYQPSSPRYTSQFVENNLPMDLMMKAGEQKYAQQQQFAQSVGQMSALNATLTPGYRTAYMAPEVINRWDQKINEFAQKYSNSYDSPQAIMELYKLHSQWSGDPDVQLIKYDREVGNKEWDKMIEKTDTYATDINKNIDHATGMLKQFQSGNQYTPYSPLIKTQDTYKHWGEEFRTIEPTKSIGHQEGTYTDSAGVLRHGLQNVNIETRDPGMLQSKAMEIAKRIHDGTDQFALYHRESLAQGLGREPTMEEIYNSLVPIAEAARTLNPKSIARYVHMIAAAFNLFYEIVPVLKEPDMEKRVARLALVEAFSITLKNAFYLLGIEPLNEM